MLQGQKVGIIGAGSFGTAIANLLAYNVDVLLYSRKADLAVQINETRQNLGIVLSDRVTATNDLQEVAESCTLLFPVVPSDSFRSMMRHLSPYLRPYHILIHGTKGLDTPDLAGVMAADKLITRKDVHTMSEVVLQESVVRRIGCLSGPNLAQEILEGLPTATVIGSNYDEVIEMGKAVLSSRVFHVFGTKDMLGAELAGALKNIIAIGSGILKGKSYGKNLQAMLITRGLIEMTRFGVAMGATHSAFFGTAGIGDLIATATSKKSRNFTFGYRLGQGESIQAIQRTMPELAEGVRTLSIAVQLAKYYKLHVPITNMLYKVVFEGFEFDRAMDFLMTYPYDVDVDIF